jgi:hypothetical protein
MRTKNILTKLVMGISALVLTLGIASVSPTSVWAAPSCGTQSFCVWDGTNFSGDVVGVTIPSAFGACISIPTWMQNRASSYYNSSDHGLIWYDGDRCAIGTDIAALRHIRGLPRSRHP